jgi:hypothetical protein
VLLYCSSVHLLWDDVAVSANVYCSSVQLYSSATCVSDDVAVSAPVLLQCTGVQLPLPVLVMALQYVLLYCSSVHLHSRVGGYWN